MTIDPELSVHSYTFDGNFDGDITSAISDLELENVEGAYRASWSFDGEQISEGGLRAWFYNRLMYQIKIIYGGQNVWSGYVWEMELLIGKLSFKRSMTEMANVLAATYSSDGDLAYVEFDGSASDLPSGTSVDENDSVWLSANESVTQYGRHEQVLDSNGSVDEAKNLAYTGIGTIPDPFNRSIVYKPQDKSVLRITAVGRMVIVNKFKLLSERLRYHPNYEDLSWEDTERKNIDWTVGDEVARIVDLINYHSGWLYPIKIADNDTLTKVGVSSTTGAFDRLVELTKLTNSNGDRYQLQITEDGGVVYDVYDETPRYMLQTAEIGIRNYDNTIPKWDAQPGIVKSVAGWAGPILPTSWLGDNTLIPIERTTMRQSDEFASFYSRTIDVVEMENALYAHLRSLEED